MYTPGIVVSAFGEKRFSPLLRLLQAAAEEAGLPASQSAIGDFVIDSFFVYITEVTKIFQHDDLGSPILSSFQAERAATFISAAQGRFTIARERAKAASRKPRASKQVKEPKVPALSSSKRPVLEAALQRAGASGLTLHEVLDNEDIGELAARRHLRDLVREKKIRAETIPHPTKAGKSAPGKPQRYYWVEQEARRKLAPLPVFEEEIIQKWDAQLAAIPDDRHGLETLDAGLVTYVGLYRSHEFAVVVEDFNMEPYLEKSWRIERRQE